MEEVDTESNKGLEQGGCLSSSQKSPYNTNVVQEGPMEVDTESNRGLEWGSYSYLLCPQKPSSNTTAVQEGPMEEVDTRVQQKIPTGLNGRSVAHYSSKKKAKCILAHKGIVIPSL